MKVNIIVIFLKKSVLSWYNLCNINRPTLFTWWGVLTDLGIYVSIPTKYKRFLHLPPKVPLFSFPFKSHLRPALCFWDLHVFLCTEILEWVASIPFLGGGHVSCGIFPNQGLNQALQWKCWILTTCPPGNSHNSLFHFIAEWYSIVWIYCNLFIHSSFDGHLHCFQFLAIVSKTTMNIQVRIFLWMYVFIFLG